MHLNINSAEGDYECSMDELETINNFLRERTGENSDVIMGMGYDATLGQKLGITLIATGFELEVKRSLDSRRNYYFKYFRFVLIKFKSSFWQDFWLRKLLESNNLKKYTWLIAAYFFAGFEVQAKDNFEDTVKKNHIFETSNEAASDKINKSLFQVELKM